jgi:DNA repair ATPase RecN
VISVVAILLILAAVAGSVFMTGALVTLWHRVRRLETASGADRALEQASDRIDLLLDQVQSVADGLESLRERLDFTERLLVEGRTGDVDDTTT